MDLNEIARTCQQHDVVLVNQTEDAVQVVTPQTHDAFLLSGENTGVDVGVLYLHQHGKWHRISRSTWNDTVLTLPLAVHLGP